VLRILTRLYSATKQIHDAGILTGAGWVELPAGHQFPADLIDWLLADPSIRDVHQQLIVQPFLSPNPPFRLDELVQMFRLWNIGGRRGSPLSSSKPQKPFHQHISINRV